MIKETWFDSLTQVGLRDQHSWLVNLPSRAERIVNFGCWSGGEPFALIWTLDAKKIMVVEIEEKNIKELVEQIDIVKHRCPESLQGRTFEYVCRDMTEYLPELPDQYYDLAYCENVLYILHLHGGIDAVERGISQMIRVVKPNGFIVAVEPKFDAKFKTQKVLGVDMHVPVRMSEPKNMHRLFGSKALRKLEIPGSPPYTYCYQRNIE
jgi:SAM-dependent methyltransferase